MFQASKDQQAFVAQQIESSAKEIKEHQKKTEKTDGFPPGLMIMWTYRASQNKDRLAVSY